MDANLEVLQNLSQQNYGLDLNGALRQVTGLNSDANGVCVQLFGTSRNACFTELQDLLSVGHALSLPGASGAYASTPDHASLDITSDIDIRVDLTVADWTPSSQRTIASKWGASGGANRSWRFVLNTTGTLGLVTTHDGTTQRGTGSSTTPTPDSDGRLAVRVTFVPDNGSNQSTATYYTAPTIEGPWVQLGTVTNTATATSIFAGTAPMEIGTDFAGTGSALAADVHAVEVRNGIDGPVVASPDFRPLRSGTSSFADSTGKTWTVHGGAEVVVLNIF